MSELNISYFIEDILEERDIHKYGSAEYHTKNLIKACILEDLKSSWVEKVAYFNAKDIENIPYGFSKINTIPNIPMYEDKRSILEYNGGNTRQIIPYCLVRYENEYYFVLREDNGDDRLNGNIGLLGGHTDSKIEDGMYRELEEEANINRNNIKNISLVGIIKDSGTGEKYDVSIDHIGLVYIIELKQKRTIRMFEQGIQTGILVSLSDFVKYEDRFEPWLKLTIDALFSN